MTPEVIEHLTTLKHNPIKNYILPGLTSWMLLDNVVSRVRMFEMNREQHNFITPHSHRFDFSCCVLNGWVENTIWSELNEYQLDQGDCYVLSEQVYLGNPGEYATNKLKNAYFKNRSTIHKTGEWYSMKHDAIHSIKFSCGAKVLFFEGVTVSDKSLYLEPISEGMQVHTLKKEPWMFIK